jgi:cytochrome c
MFVRFSALLSLCLLFFSCSQVNTESRRHHEEKRPTFRHGIIPVDTAKENKAVQLRPLNLQAVERGRTVYIANCLECHGEDGRGGGPSALKQERLVPNLQLTVRDVPHFDFFISFSQYQGTMPGWQTPLSEQERADVVEYLKSLVN